MEWRDVVGLLHCSRSEAAHTGGVARCLGRRSGAALQEAPLRNRGPEDRGSGSLGQRRRGHSERQGRNQDGSCQGTSVERTHEAPPHIDGFSLADCDAERPARLT